MKLPGLHTPPAVEISGTGYRLRKMLGDTYRETVLYGGPAGWAVFDEACEFNPEIFDMAVAMHARAVLDRAPVPGPGGRFILSDWLT